MSLETQNNSQKIRFEESDNKITQYFRLSNIASSKENNTVAENKTNENHNNKENKKQLVEIKSGKRKRNSSFVKITKNSTIEKICKIYENFKTTKNILQYESNFRNILQNKITIYEDNKTPPLAINEEGSLILKCVYFWILFILIKLNNIRADLQSEIFFAFFENATECCEENKNILCDFFYEYIEAITSHEEIIKRIKINLPNDSLIAIDFSEIGRKDYKYAIQNYKFFDSDRFSIKSGKIRKPLSEQRFEKNKISKLPEINKAEQSNSIILDRGSVVSFGIDKYSFEIKHENKINLKDLFEKIIKNQKSFISSHQISLNIFNTKSLKIDNQTSFSVFPPDKLIKRISFINNFEQEAGSLYISNQRERDMHATLLEKIEIYRDIELNNTTKSKRSQSFDSNANKVYNMNKKITRNGINASSNKIVNDSEEEYIIPDKNKTLKSKSLAKNKSKVKTKSKANKTRKNNLK